MTNLRLIDAHVHLYPAEVNRNPAGWAEAHHEPAWSGLCTRVRRNGRPVQGFPALAELLREMDRAGVERSVLLGWYWQNTDTCAGQNRFYADCVRAHPDRLSAFATLQPLDGVANVQVEMQRARDAGLTGLGELSPHAQGYSIDEPGFRAALECAGEWGWPVNLHTTDPLSPEYPGRVLTPPADFLRLGRELPGVTLVLAHWGGLLPLREPAAAELENLYYDTAASPLTYDESVWRRMLAAVPAGRVLFGSDYPLNVYPKDESSPGMSRFVTEARTANAPEPVLRGNAVRLLRL